MTPQKEKRLLKKIPETRARRADQQVCDSAISGCLDDTAIFPAPSNDFCGFETHTTRAFFFFPSIIFAAHTVQFYKSPTPPHQTNPHFRISAHFLLSPNCPKT
jgi:hypothetical protein